MLPNLQLIYVGTIHEEIVECQDCPGMQDEWPVENPASVLRSSEPMLSTTGHNSECVHDHGQYAAEKKIRSRNSLPTRRLASMCACEASKQCQRMLLICGSSTHFTS